MRTGASGSNISRVVRRRANSRWISRRHVLKHRCYAGANADERGFRYRTSVGCAKGIDLARQLKNVRLYFGTILWIEVHDARTKKADTVIETTQVYRPPSAG